MLVATGLDDLHCICPHFDCRLAQYTSWEEAQALLMWRAYVLLALHELRIDPLVPQAACGRTRAKPSWVSPRAALCGFAADVALDMAPLALASRTDLRPDGCSYDCSVNGVSDAVCATAPATAVCVPNFAALAATNTDWGIRWMDACFIIAASGGPCLRCPLFPAPAQLPDAGERQGRHGCGDTRQAGVALHAELAAPASTPGVRLVPSTVENASPKPMAPRSNPIPPPRLRACMASPSDNINADDASRSMQLTATRARVCTSQVRHGCFSHQVGASRTLLHRRAPVRRGLAPSMSSVGQ